MISVVNGLTLSKIALALLAFIESDSGDSTCLNVCASRLTFHLSSLWHVPAFLIYTHAIAMGADFCFFLH